MQHQHPWGPGETCKFSPIRIKSESLELWPGNPGFGPGFQETLMAAHTPFQALGSGGVHPGLSHRVVNRHLGLPPNKRRACPHFLTPTCHILGEGLEATERGLLQRGLPRTRHLRHNSLFFFIQNTLFLPIKALIAAAQSPCTSWGHCRGMPPLPLRLQGGSGTMPACTILVVQQQTESPAHQRNSSDHAPHTSKVLACKEIFGTYLKGY